MLVLRVCVCEYFYIKHERGSSVKSCTCVTVTLYIVSLFVPIELLPGEAFGSLLHLG